MSATLTKDELRHLRAGHVALWTWLAETGGKYKEEWPGWADNDGEYADASGNSCLACNSTMSDEMEHHDCRNCPIDWGRMAEFEDSNPCADDEGAYFMWARGKNRSSRRRIAAQIATMWPEGE